MRPKIILWFFILFFSVNSAAYAQVYQYFNDDGTLVVTDNPYGIKRPRPKSVPQPRQENQRQEQAQNIQPKQQVFSHNFIEDVSYGYYPVAGRTFSEAIASTMENGPYDNEENRRFAGQTRWSVGWSYKFGAAYKLEGGYLRADVNITDFDFRWDISVLLPELTPESRLAEGDLRMWEEFMGGLLEHENDHVRITQDPSYRAEAVGMISAIKELLVPYDPRYEAGSLIKTAVEAETAKVGYSLIKKIKARNDDYDRITEHGIKHQMRAAFFGGR